MISQEAVRRTQQNHPDLAERLNNFGVMLGRRYQRTGAMSDLEEAIGAARQAVDTTPEDHPDCAACLNNLGNKLESRYERSGAMADLDDASVYLQNAWNTTTAIPFHRIQAAATCIKLLSLQHKVVVATQLGKDVIDLLPMVNTKLLDRNDQQYVVSTFAGVAADLCALLLASEQVDEALQYLEKGRAVILS